MESTQFLHFVFDGVDPFREDQLPVVQIREIDRVGGNYVDRGVTRVPTHNTRADVLFAAVVCVWALPDHAAPRRNLMWLTFANNTRNESCDGRSSFAMR